MVRVPNGITPGIDYVHVVEGANIKVTAEEIGLEVREFVTVAYRNGDGDNGTSNA